MNLAQLQAVAPKVQLFPWESEDARRIAAGRNNENLNRGDRASYDPTKIMSDNLAANIHSTIAEIGAARIIGGYSVNAVWPRKDHSHWAMDLPDIYCQLTEVEVKWRRRAYSMPIDKKDAERQRLVLWVEAVMMGCLGTECDHKDATNFENDYARIVGAGWAHELWEGSPQYGSDVNRRKVSCNQLVPVFDVLDIRSNS